MTPPQARHWRSAADALTAVRREPGLTRAELGRRLGLDSGPISDLIKRLTGAELITEQRATPSGRGRPTTTVQASPSGPLALTLDIRHGDWRLGTCDIDGRVDILATGRHDGRADEVLAALRTRVGAAAVSMGSRLVGLGVAVPGPVADDRLIHATMLGWRDADIASLAPEPDLTVIVANDATMAAVAEARLHSPRPHTLVHIVVEIGVGGALVVDGSPVSSARGLQGEFGHLPFGDPDSRCPCGARGCWAVPFHVARVARALRTEAPADPRRWLRELFTDATASDDVRRMREALTADLGRGIAGLVNALDPDAVTLGGLSAELRSAAPGQFDEALLGGLMSVHRERPPAVVAARGGEDAPLVGVGLSVFDAVLDAEMLACWAGRTRVHV